MSKPKYGQYKIKIVGGNGNAFMLLSSAKRQLREQNADPKIFDEFSKEAMSGDYDHLLKTFLKFFDVS